MNATKRILGFVLVVFTLFANAGAYAFNTNDVNHIIINQIYGGGEENDGKDIETPVSHAFVELYNPTDKTVSLDNWSLQYAADGDKWRVYTLKGEIKSHSSYLVRCKAYNPNARLQINNYDASWDIGLNNKGCKILLKNNNQSAKTANPYKSAESGYIDMVGVAGNRYYYSVDGYETDYPQIQSKQKAIRRINFSDTDNNAKDFAAIDYRTADIGEVGPRCSGDGERTYTEFKRNKEIKAVPLDCAFLVVVTHNRNKRLIHNITAVFVKHIHFGGIVVVIRNISGMNGKIIILVCQKRSQPAPFGKLTAC